MLSPNQLHEDQIQLIPVGQLTLSPLNVRKTDAEQGIEELAALILSQGLLQNLTVYPETDEHGTVARYAVVAGGRRWRALQRLLDQGQITADYPVLCHVIAYERAVELSLAENSGRAEMHPADQFEAFRALADAGQSVEDIAARFGVEPVAVQRRLKLANVAPCFITLYRERKTTLEHLMALAITDDQDRQQQAWNSLKSYERYPEALRRILTEHDISTRHPLARYVGLREYQKAGGVVRRDLFAEDGEETLLDGALLHQLAAAKLDKVAAKLKREGLPWVDVHLQLDYATRAAYGSVGTVEREPSAAERKRLDRLNAEREQLAAQAADAEDDGADGALSGQIREIDTKIAQMHVGLTESDPEQTALAGAVVSVARNGKVSIERALLRPEDARRFRGARTRTERETAAPREHSAALVRRLTAHRTLALQAELARQPMVAAVALTHRLVLDTFYMASNAHNNPVNINGDTNGLADQTQSLEGCEAQKALETRRAALAQQLPEEPVAVLTWLLQQSHETVLSLLAYCVAVTVDGVQMDEGPSKLDELARAVQLDMRKWWSVTAANYLGAVPKARILGVVTEGVSAEAAAGLEKLKKAALAEAAERQLAGTGWLPRVLRIAAA
jgi:ParB family chromosome partitioning protein